MTRTAYIALVAVVAVLAAAKAGPPSIEQANKGNIDFYLKDRALVSMQISCVMGTGRCNRLGIQLKQSIPEVLNNNCGRCTPTQAQNARKLVSYIETNYPKEYVQIVSKYRH